MITMAETITAVENDGGEEAPEIISSSSQAKENDDVSSLDEEQAEIETAAETVDHGGEEPPKALPPTQQVTEEKEKMSSLDEEPAAATAEVTAERTESQDQDNNCTEDPTTIIDPPPQAADENVVMFSVDEDPVEERNHEAEIFAGFSLESNGIRFRGPRSGKTVRVFEDRFSTQLILEETRGGDDGKSGMELREPVQLSSALTLLRGIYSVIAVFMGGFLFILGFDILLFLFIHLISVFNQNQNIGILDFVASFFSVPVFVYSLSFAMTLVTNFVIDTFYGNPFLRSFGLGVVFAEWMAFVFYLGVPLLTFIITLFMGKPNWWEVSLLTWFASVLTFWGFFSACVFYFEISQCLKLERDRHSEKGVTEDMGCWDKTLYWLMKAKDATKHTMKIRLAGKETKYKKQKGQEKPRYEDKHNRCPVGLCSLLTTKLPCYKQFDEEEQKEEISSLGEVLGLTSYVTRYSWSLDKLFCRSERQTSSIFLTSGEARVNEHQITSSIVCRVVGDLMIILLVVGLFVWLSDSGMNSTAGIVLIALLLLVVAAYIAYNTKYLKEIFKDTSDQSEATWTRFWEVRRINEPSDRFIWICVVAEIVLFYLWPLISLCVQQNTPSAVLFSFLGFFSFTRHFLNGALLLRAYEHDFFSEVITYSDDDITDEERKRRKRRWKKKSRTYNMLSIGNTSRKFWIAVFSLLVFFFVLVVLAYARTQGDDGFKSKTTTPVEGYEYRRGNNLPYPTCVLRVTENDLVDADLLDYAFLANLAYTEPDEEEASLNSWFGNNTLRVNNTLLEDFRKDFDFVAYGISSNSAVSYKLVQSVVYPKYVMISIRGTATVLDVMADAQLWISAMLFQGVRELLPLGNVFTPILHRLVNVVSAMETSAIAEVAYYQEIREFARYLLDKDYNVRVTGHSLGGGLALITGAQAKVSAVGFSAPNAKLSRDTFVGKSQLPLPVSLYDLNTYTFNVVPNRDPIPMIDDKANLYQHINCTASSNDFAGCHSIVRSICELQYTCGSKASFLENTYRPVPCECVLEYGYPSPTPLNRSDSDTNNLSFDDECREKYPCKWGDETQQENDCT